MSKKETETNKWHLTFRICTRPTSLNLATASETMWLNTYRCSWSWRNRLSTVTHRTRNSTRSSDFKTPETDHDHYFAEFWPLNCFFNVNTKLPAFLVAEQRSLTWWANPLKNGVTATCWNKKTSLLNVSMNTCLHKQELQLPIFSAACNGRFDNYGNIVVLLRQFGYFVFTGSRFVTRCVPNEETPQR